MQLKMMCLAHFRMILCLMNWKWGVGMNKTYVYYCEGEDDQKQMWRLYLIQM